MVCTLRAFEQYSCAAYYSIYVKLFAVKQLEQGFRADFNNIFSLNTEGKRAETSGDRK